MEKGAPIRSQTEAVALPLIRVLDFGLNVLREMSDEGEPQELPGGGEKGLHDVDRPCAEHGYGRKRG